MAFAGVTRFRMLKLALLRRRCDTRRRMGRGVRPPRSRLGGGLEAGAAVPSVRSMHNREAAAIFAGCLTTTCTGAAEAMFTWLLVRPFGGPVMSGVRHPDS